MRAALVLVSLMLANAARAEDPAQDLRTEIGLARVAEELGDAELSARLGPASARLASLVAVRASPYARAPERQIAALAAHACGRDPLLAPEAAFALREIAERLRPSELAARESLRSDLEAARAALACVDRPPPRADIAQALAELAAALERLLR